MREFQIKCVIQDKDKIITGVCIDKERYTVEEIVNKIDNEQFSFYTYRDNKKAKVYAKKHPATGKWYLTTEPDKTTGNNLDFLPKC